MQKETSRTIAYVLWSIVSIFYAYQYILRVMPNVMLEHIIGQFGVSTASFGQFSGVYYIGYALMHLPLGILLDRYGPKKILTLCILCSVAGILPMIYSTNWAFPVFGRFLVGLGSSGAILGVFKVVRMLFSKEQFSRMLSLSVMVGLIGAIYGGGPVSYLLQIHGYTALLQLLIGVGLILAGLTYWMAPNVTQKESGSVMSEVKEVISNKKVVAACIFSGLMVGPLEGFADVWASVFLKNVYGYEEKIASTLPSLIFIGMCFGSPILSFLGSKLGSLSKTIIGSGITMALAFFLVLSQILSISAIGVCFVLVGICCAYQILAITLISGFVREEVVGCTTAMVNMIVMLFGYLFHTIIGTMVGQFGGPTSLTALLYGVGVVPVALCWGVAGFYYLGRKKKALVN